MLHNASWRARVVIFGWRVKNGGKEQCEGNWKPFADVEVGTVGGCDNAPEPARGEVEVVPEVGVDGLGTESPGIDCEYEDIFMLYVS